METYLNGAPLTLCLFRLVASLAPEIPRVCVHFFLIGGDKFKRWGLDTNKYDPGAIQWLVGSDFNLYYLNEFSIIVIIIINYYYY
jgi:hypothetical protein